NSGFAFRATRKVTGSNPVRGANPDPRPRSQVPLPPGFFVVSRRASPLSNTPRFGKVTAPKCPFDRGYEQLPARNSLSSWPCIVGRLQHQDAPPPSAASVARPPAPPVPPVRGSRW